jgi:hypothetical protein
MGRPTEPEKVVLIAGLLASSEELLAAARARLVDQHGPIEKQSEVWPFLLTHYYADEIGPVIVRQMVAFRQPFDRGRLAAVKLASNALEDELARVAGGVFPRPVNIDPGYVNLGHLVLATTKERPHRIYLGSGIFAEITLLYESGGWRPLPWTYPDYAAPTYHPFLDAAREGLKAARKRGETA